MTAQMGGDVQPIASRNPARWMQNRDVTNLGAFRVQRFLNLQWSAVSLGRQTRAPFGVREGHFQIGMPMLFCWVGVDRRNSGRAARGRGLQAL